MQVDHIYHSHVDRPRSGPGAVHGNCLPLERRTSSVRISLRAIESSRRAIGLEFRDGNAIC